MTEAANALNEAIVTYESQGPQEVLELQQIPKIPEAEPLLQQDANPGKIYYYRKILKTNKNFSPLSKAYEKKSIMIYGSVFLNLYLKTDGASLIITKQFQL